MSKTVEDRFKQLKIILEDESCSPNKRQSALKVLLKFPDTHDYAVKKLDEFADNDQIWAIEYSIKDLKKREDSSVMEAGIDLG
jgi:hypothetical protein